MKKHDLLNLINTLPEDVEVRVLGGYSDTDINLSRAVITHFVGRYSGEDFYLLQGVYKGENYIQDTDETIIAFLDESLNVISVEADNNNGKER